MFTSSVHRLRFLLLLPGILAGCSSGPDYSSISVPGTDSAIELRTDAIPADATENLPETLTLIDAIERALRNDAQIQAAIARTRAALADVQQARLLPNPLLSVSARFPEGGGSSIVDVDVSADLLSLLTRSGRIRAADSRLKAAVSESLVVVLDVIAQVQETYAAIQSQEAQGQVLSERQRLLDELLNVARSRVRLGEAPQLDVLTLESERTQLDADALQATADARDQRLVLARLIGEPSSAATWAIAPWEPLEPLPTGESAWIETALKNRPEVQARQWELAALGEDVANSGWGVLEGSQIGAASELDETWSVGPAVTFPLPLFDFGQAGRNRAQAQRLEARHKLTQTQRQVIEEVRRALASMEYSQQGLQKVRDQLIPGLQQRREQAEAAYKSGIAELTTLLLAEQELQEGRSKLIELQQKTSQSALRLQRTVGGPGIVPVNPATMPVK